MEEDDAAGSCPRGDPVGNRKGVPVLPVLGVDLPADDGETSQEKLEPGRGRRRRSGPEQADPSVPA